jgi:hypothetical protein
MRPRHITVKCRRRQRHHFPNSNPHIPFVLFCGFLLSNRFVIIFSGREEEEEAAAVMGFDLDWARGMGDLTGGFLTRFSLTTLPIANLQN